MIIFFEASCRTMNTVGAAGYSAVVLVYMYIHLYILIDCSIEYIYIYIYIYVYTHTHTHTQGVRGGTDQTSGGCSLC